MVELSSLCSSLTVLILFIDKIKQCSAPLTKKLLRLKILFKNEDAQFAKIYIQDQRRLKHNIFHQNLR